jgi:hypothetical protein
MPQLRQLRHRDDLRSNFWRRKLRPAILARDNWRCHVCGQPIDPNLKSPHPLSASVDHIRGAATRYDPRFLRAAHRGCNMRRGDPTRTGDPKPRTVTRW